MWKLSVKFRVTVNLDSAEIMYLQDKEGGEGLGYPGLDRCPVCLSNIQPPQDTRHGTKASIIVERRRDSVVHLKMTSLFYTESAALMPCCKKCASEDDTH